MQKKNTEAFEGFSDNPREGTPASIHGALFSQDFVALLSRLPLL
jgi:hypothetical protein